MSENNERRAGALKGRFTFSRKKTVPGNTVPSPINTVVEVEPPVAEKGKYKQLLENIVINGLLNIAEDKLADEMFIESVFSKAYELLPVPVRLVVKREWCLSYLLSRKAPLLVQLQLYRAGRNSPAEPSAPTEKEQPTPPALPPTAQ